MPRYQRRRRKDDSILDLALGLTAVLILVCGWKLYTFFRPTQAPSINFCLPLPSWLIYVSLTGFVLMCWLAYFWEQRQHREQLEAAKTLEQLRALSPGQFEEYVKLLFEKRGYRVKLTPTLSNHGVDLYVTKEGKKAIVQCKKYRGNVGEPAIRDFYGTIMHESAAKGYFITTGYFSRAARTWAEGKPIELIDGSHLLRIAEAINREG